MDEIILKSGEIKLQEEQRYIPVEEDLAEQVCEKIIYLLGDFKAATKEQIVKCIGDKDICGQVLSKMVKKRMIRWNDKKQWYEHSGYTDKEILEAAGLRKALAVYSDYAGLGAGDYVVSPDSNVILTFEMDGVFVDIIYTKYGSELQIGNILHMKERYLPEQDKKKLTRIVIVDLEKQIPDIHIFGTQYYVLVDAEGKAEYITNNKTIM